eukprot:PITA_02475
MQKKSETYSKFCEFKALAEKESGKKVKALRSDNGGEFISGEFKNFCSAEGIRRELIAPHNPQQNGVTERKNRMIVGAARAMLHDQGLPLHLWAEACNTVVYVQNRCPHKILGMSTPEEAYSDSRKTVVRRDIKFQEEKAMKCSLEVSRYSTVSRMCAGSRERYWAGSPTDRKSTFGGIFSIGSTTISWYNRKQRSVALSSVEAEYMATSLAACEAIWMRKILVRLFRSHLEPTVIYCDNQSCIKLLANPVFHDRSKHIDIRYHHIRDCVQRRVMLHSYIPTEDQDVDILTKALTRRKLEYHRGNIGVVDNPILLRGSIENATI